MAVGINNNNSSMHLLMQRRDKLSTEKKTLSDQNEIKNALAGDDSEIVEDESPAALLQRFASATDEMSAAMAQFRSRRDYDKKFGLSAESSFDQVLDEDVFPKADQLVKIMKGEKGATIENFLRHARALFPDDSDLVLVLREMLRQRELDEVVRKRLKELLSQVEKETDPKRLKAGINVALKARLFGKKLKMSPAIMRESYRGFLESEDHEIDVYQDWVTRFGAEKRSIVVNFMEDAVLSDIDSADPSCSNMEFGYLLGRVGQIKIIRSCDALFIHGVLNDPTVREVNHDERSWLFFMFGILRDPTGIDELLTLTAGDHLRYIRRREQAVFLQSVYYNCKKLPCEAFISLEERNELLIYFETLINKALQKENIEMRNALDAKN